MLPPSIRFKQRIGVCEHPAMLFRCSRASGARHGVVSLSAAHHRCPRLQGDHLLDCQTESSASMLSSSPWPTAASMLMLCIMAIAAAITTSSSNGDATATFVRHLGVVFLGYVCSKYSARMCIVPGCRRFCDTLTFLWRGCSENSACTFLQDCCFFGAKET